MARAVPVRADALPQSQDFLDELIPRHARQILIHASPAAPRSALPSRDLRRLPAERHSHPRRLKYWTARSCFSAAARVLKVPRLRRLPVLGSFFRE
jgi:hypothetical protein